MSTDTKVTNLETPNLKELTVLIPAHNEEECIEHCLRELSQTVPEAKIIVVNDGSTDNTATRASQVDRVKIIHHRRNRGYGAALKTGIRQTTTPYVMWFDADGQHLPGDIFDLVRPVINGEVDAMLGQRTKGSAFSVRRMPGKWLLRIFSQIVARQRIPDLNCGFRCFRTGTLKQYLHLLPDGFSASATSTLIMIKRGYRIGFLPIKSQERVGQSTVRIFRDGFKTLGLILRIMLLFDAFRFFAICALGQIFPAIVYSFYKFKTVGLGLPPLGVLVIISGILTFFMGLISSQISEMRQERFEFGSDPKLGYEE